MPAYATAPPPPQAQKRHVAEVMARLERDKGLFLSGDGGGSEAGWLCVGGSRAGRWGKGLVLEA